MDINAAGMNPARMMNGSTLNNNRSVVESRRFADMLQREQERAAKAMENMTPEQAAKAKADDKKLRDACNGFEGMFLNIMYTQMRETVPKDTLFGDSNADKILNSMLDSAMMEQAAKGGGIGIADMLYRQMKVASTGLSVEQVAEEMKKKAAEK